LGQKGQSRRRALICTPRREAHCGRPQERPECRSSWFFAMNYRAVKAGASRGASRAVIVAPVCLAIGPLLAARGMRAVEFTWGEGSRVVQSWRGDGEASHRLRAPHSEVNPSHSEGSNRDTLEEPKRESLARLNRRPDSPKTSLANHSLGPLPCRPHRSCECTHDFIQLPNTLA
jgi:hypothetical protein